MFRCQGGCDVDSDEICDNRYNREAYSSLKPMVGTTTGSMAAMSGAWKGQSKTDKRDHRANLADCPLNMVLARISAKVIFCGRASMSR